MELAKLQALISVGRFKKNSVVNFYLNDKSEVIARSYDVEDCYITANLGDAENDTEKWFNMSKEVKNSIQVPISFLKHVLKNCKDNDYYELEVGTETIKSEDVPTFRFTSGKYSKMWRISENRFSPRNYELDYDKKLNIGLRACKPFILDVLKASALVDSNRSSMSGVNVRMIKKEIERVETSHVEFIATNGHYASSFRIPYDWELVSNMEHEESFTIPYPLLNTLRKIPEKVFDVLSFRYWRHEETQHTNTQLTCWSESLGMTIKVNHMEHKSKFPDVHGLIKNINKGKFYSINIERDKLLKDLSYQHDLFGKDRALDFLFADGQIILSDNGKVDHSFRDDVMSQEVGRYYMNGDLHGIPNGFRRGFNCSYLSNVVGTLKGLYVSLNISHQDSENNTLRINEGTSTSYIMGLRGDQYSV